MATKTPPKLESSSASEQPTSPETENPAPGPAQDASAVEASQPASAPVVPARDPRWDVLARPFPSDQIEILPKPYKKDSPKGKCAECGGYHGLPAVHLDYIGHAGITMRLNEVDPTWNWEPLALAPNGLPLITNDGLWIKLTVLGVTRLGFGDAQGKSGPNAVKELIGDALRNAAMRFGVGTYLWSKSEAALALKERQGGDEDPSPQTSPKPLNGNGANGNGKHPAAARAAAQQTQREMTPHEKLKLEVTRLLCDVCGVRNGDGSWDMASTMIQAAMFLPNANNDVRGLVPLDNAGLADLKQASETQLHGIKDWLTRQAQVRGPEPEF